jgi:Cytochrome c2
MRRIIAAACAVVLIAGCKRHSDTDPASPNAWAVGNPEHGATLIAQYGCGSCHTISGIPNADGLVGPPLDGMARRVYIAGMLQNRPDNLVMWIQHPQAIVPGNVMPDMGIGKADARDMAAYLYTRK